MNQTHLDLYTDDLYATATGLSQMLDGRISHDAFSRFLSHLEYTSKDLWLQVKSTVRKVAFKCVRKPLRYCDLKTRQEKRCSEFSKNEYMRSMIGNCVRNQIKFSWVLADIWLKT